jgi:prolipoprotein diacylglyceryltransferase
MFYGLKPYKELTENQKKWLEKNDKKRSLPVHPTQLYSSINGGVLALILYLFWRRSQKALGDALRQAGNSKNNNAQHALRQKLFTKAGCTFGLMFIIYGITRFFIEFVRDDNPYEFDEFTISQIIGVAMVAFGVFLMLIFEKMKPQQLK